MFTMVAPSGRGRSFSSRGRVRLGDASPGGRLRCDAMARILQDVSDDDTRDAGLDGMAWVVRRTVLDVHTFPRYLETYRLVTWCAGLGSRWAERRTTLIGDDGGHVEAATLWVSVDPASNRPTRPSPAFLEVFGPSCNERTVSSKLIVPPVTPDAVRVAPATAALAALAVPAAPPALAAPPAPAPAPAPSPSPSSSPASARAVPAATLDAVTEHPWSLRFSDFDVLGHVNNAIYWAIVEELLAEARDLRAPMRAIVEHEAPLEPGVAPRLFVRRSEDSLAATLAWLPAPTDSATASASSGTPLAPFDEVNAHRGQRFASLLISRLD